MQRWKAMLTIEATVWINDPHDEYTESIVEVLAGDAIELSQPADEATEVELENVIVGDVLKLSE